MKGRAAVDRRQAEQSALEHVRDVYSQLEARPVQRQCVRRTDCCRFHLTGLTPYLTRGEALVAALALRAGGTTRIAARRDGNCPLLDDAGTCRIYEARPLACRTHYCSAAGGPFPRRTVLDLIRRLEEVDVVLGGSGGEALPVALERALAIVAARRKRRDAAISQLV